MSGQIVPGNRNGLTATQAYPGLGASGCYILILKNIRFFDSDETPLVNRFNTQFGLVLTEPK